ncbi:MAG: PAS domain-containing protein [Thermoplasmata archaeon]|nr:PAS domain-containing protein [Thermoplasmata archaeon]
MIDIPVIVLEIFLIFNIALFLSLTYRAWQLRKVRGTITFSLILLCTASISFFYLMEVASQDLDMKVFWLKMKLLPFTILPGLILVFSLHYMKRRSRVPRWVLLLLFMEPTFFMLNIWAEPFPSLFSSSNMYIRDGIIDMIEWNVSGFYFSHLLYSAFLVVVAILYMVASMVKAGRGERGQYAILILAMMIPLFAAILETRIVIPGVYIDWPVFSLSISSFIIFLGFRSFNLFRVNPIPLSTVLENLDDGVVIIDRNMLVQDLNPNAAKMLGVKVKGNIANHFTDVFPKWAHMMKWSPGENESKREIFQDEDRNRILLLRSSRVLCDNGRVEGYLFSSKDITEEESSKAKVERYNVLLSIINKVLRHDLLNDLWIMQISVERSLETGDRSLLKNALRSMEKSMETIKRMRALEEESLRDEDPKVFDLSHVFRKLEDHNELDISIEGNAEVIADEGLFTVFNNLINNAIKHGKASKMIIRVKKAQKKVTVSVLDNGIGIPSRLRDSIFNEGVTSGEEKGSGLGLYITLRSMHRIGGDIRLDREFNGGTRFILTFLTGT